MQLYICKIPVKGVVLTETAMFRGCGTGRGSTESSESYEWMPKRVSLNAVPDRTAKIPKHNAT